MLSKPRSGRTPIGSSSVPDRASRVVAGLDLGTSGVRAAAFDREGRPVAMARRAFAPAPEQDAEEYFRAAVACLAELRAHAPDAVGIGGQGPTLVVTDERFRPVAPALTWLDGRAVGQAARLSARVGRSVRPQSLAAKVLWLRESSPAVLERGRWIFQAWDYLVSRLVGRAIALLPVPSDLVAATGAPAVMFPAALEPPAIAGAHDGVAVVGCFVDSFNGILGSGVRALGQGCINAGTSGTVTVMCARERASIEVAGMPAASRLLSATGSSLEWFRSTFAPDAPVERLLDEAQTTPAGARGVLFIPYLAGTRDPAAADGPASGLFAGLRLEHGRGDLARAVLEGSAFSFRRAVDDLAASGVAIRELRICGGQARSRLWNEIKASALERELIVPRILDASLLGCALLAATAIEWFPGIDEAVAGMTGVGERVAPRWDYREAYSRWSALLRATA